MKNLTAGEWLKCRVQWQHKNVNIASLALAMLHAMECRETTLLSTAAFLAAIYVEPRYQVLLKYFQKTVAHAHVATL